ncbi:hypothetical protein MMC12_000538 [Toensbergia leucococca]|nr:hypothetical protein [Toensbergia leucococca]
MLYHILPYSLLLFTLLNPIILARSIPQPQPLRKRVPNSSYGVGALNVYASGAPFLTLDGGVTFDFQSSDSNFVAYLNGAAQWASNVHKGGTCGNGNVCQLVFQGDGNLVSYYNGVASWNTGTGSNRGYALVFYDVMPYIVIMNSALTVIWHTPYPPGGGGGEGGGGGGGGGGGLGGLCAMVPCIVV